MNLTYMGHWTNILMQYFINKPGGSWTKHSWDIERISAWNISQTHLEGHKVNIVRHWTNIPMQLFANTPWDSFNRETCNWQSLLNKVTSFFGIVRGIFFPYNILTLQYKANITISAKFRYFTPKHLKQSFHSLWLQRPQ